MCLLILDCQTIQTIGQRKAFYRQIIPESSCARKETVDIDIFVTSRKGDRKTMQSIRIMSRFPSRIKKWEVKPVESVQINIYQSNTYRRDLCWLHFNDQPRVQEMYQLKDQQSCILVFVAEIAKAEIALEPLAARANVLTHIVLFFGHKTQSFMKNSGQQMCLDKALKGEVVIAIEICKNPNAIQKRKSTSAS